MRSKPQPSPFVVPKLNLKRCDLGNAMTVVAQLGTGSFGRLQLIYNQERYRMLVAKRPLTSADSSNLEEEYRYLRRLACLKCPSIPRVHLIEDGTLLVEALGASLAVLRRKADRLPLFVVSRVGVDVFKAIEGLLECGMAHRDIKPDNILRDMHGHFKLIDYGLCCELPFKDRVRLTGSARYASLTAHRGEWTRCSDMESLLYVMVEAAKGGLPWQLVQAAEPPDLETLWMQVGRGKRISTESLIGCELLQKGRERLWWQGMCSLLLYVRDNPEVKTSVVGERLAYLVGLAGSE